MEAYVHNPESLETNFFHSYKIAGMASKVFEHPFDLTKVRLQSQVLANTTRFSGPMDCLKQTWQKEGLRGLYRVCIPFHIFFSLF